MKPLPKPAPQFEFSLIGRKLTARSGILELMDDLGRAMTIEPAHAHARRGQPGGRARDAGAAAPADARTAGQTARPSTGCSANYDPPQGNPRFRRALAELLQRSFGWDIGPQNIAITTGGQSAYFYLFNLLAGGFDGGRRRKILLPLAPEYIGYADQGFEPDLFVACRPGIDWPEGREAGYSNTALTSPPWKRRCAARTSAPSPPRARPTRPATC